MSTLRLKQLVDEVRESLPAPHTPEVIEDVFVAVENNPQWRKTYDEIVYKLGKPTTNAWAGFWIAHGEGRVADQRETASRATLIESFTRVVAPAVKRNKKMKEPDAVKAMHDYYQAHRDKLPASIRDHRNVIVTLIMEGIEPEAAFASVLEKPAFAW